MIDTLSNFFILSETKLDNFEEVLLSYSATFTQSAISSSVKQKQTSFLSCLRVMADVAWAR